MRIGCQISNSLDIRVGQLPCNIGDWFTGGGKDARIPDYNSGHNDYQRFDFDILGCMVKKQSEALRWPTMWAADSYYSLSWFCQCACEAFLGDVYVVCCAKWCVL